MTAVTERVFVPEQTQVSLANLPNSHEAAQEILERARPLRDDPEYRAEFYGLGVVRTPLEELDAINGSPILIKDETAQDSGAYKRRGATNAVMQVEADTVVTFSTGNHGLSLAMAGGRRGKEVVVEVPKSISKTKETALVENGAILHYHSTFREAQLAAIAQADNPNVAVVGPFGQEAVLGQLSVGIEIVEDLRQRGLTHAKMVIPVATAGAGHLLGVALPIREAQATGELGPDIEIVAVQPENTDALGRAVRKVQAGEEPVDLFAPGELDTDCDALAITEESLSARNLAIVADTQYVDAFHTVDKLSLAKARRYLSDQLGFEVEPAAALPMAYALERADGETAFLLTVTGGNISRETKELYDDLVVEDNVRLFQEASRAQLNMPQTYLPRLGQEALRGVWRSPVTHQYVPSTAERKAHPVRTDAQVAYLGQLAAQGIELVANVY